MKTIILGLLLTVTLAASYATAQVGITKITLDSVERAQLTLLSEDRDSIRIIGFETIRIDEPKSRKAMITVFKLQTKLLGGVMNTIFFMPQDGSFMRFYGPLSDASVDCQGNTLTVSSNGLIAATSQDLRQLKLTATKNDDTKDPLYGKIIPIEQPLSPHHVKTEGIKAVFFEISNKSQQELKEEKDALTRRLNKQ
jgi:hypothetical protein